MFTLFRMKKGIRNTGLGFIAVAILTILLHSVIPHHHHLDSVYSHFSGNLKFTHHQSGGEDKATHCHAFNELAIDKTGLSINPTPEIIALQNSGIVIPKPSDCYIQMVITDIKRESQSIFLFKLLRGPPSTFSLA